MIYWLRSCLTCIHIAYCETPGCGNKGTCLAARVAAPWHQHVCMYMISICLRSLIEKYQPSFLFQTDPKRRAFEIRYITLSVFPGLTESREVLIDSNHPQFRNREPNRVEEGGTVIWGVAVGSAPQRTQFPIRRKRKESVLRVDWMRNLLSPTMHITLVHSSDPGPWQQNCTRPPRITAGPLCWDAVAHTPLTPARRVIVEP